MKVLVDFANVGSAGLLGILSLNKKDRLYIFYNESSGISFDIHRAIEKSECKKYYQKISSASDNALDIMLSSIFGNMVAEDKSSVYAIISNRTDYDVIINYWKSKGISIGKFKNVKEAMSINNNTDSNSPAESNKIQENETQNDIKGLTDEIYNLLNMRD